MRHLYLPLPQCRELLYCYDLLRLLNTLWYFEKSIQFVIWRSYSCTRGLRQSFELRIKASLWWVFFPLLCWEDMKSVAKQVYDTRLILKNSMISLGLPFENENQAYSFSFEWQCLLPLGGYHMWDSFPVISTERCLPKHFSIWSSHNDTLWLRYWTFRLYVKSEIKLISN